jgi:hypothetical protein
MEPDKLKTTAKDFFTYLGTVVLLYVSFGSLLNLLFNYINYYFPDSLTDSYYYYYDPYSAAVRFSLAVLIILFPVFWFATYYINKDLRSSPGKQELGIRKWLLYLTVFAAIAIVIGDLVTLVNTFLNGEITTRFVLKILTVLLLTGLTLTYYVLDLKGKYIEKPMLGRYLGLAVGLIVFVSVVGGFYVIGSPQNQRSIRFDQQKISDLQNIQWQIVNYWQQKEVMPTKLTDLVDQLNNSIIPLDRESGKVYEYATGTSTNFKLCADFNKESNEKAYPSPYGVGGGGGIAVMPTKVAIYPDGINENWKHPSGHYCFSRYIDPEKYPPYPKNNKGSSAQVLR